MLFLHLPLPKGASLFLLNNTCQILNLHISKFLLVGICKFDLINLLLNNLFYTSLLGKLQVLMISSMTFWLFNMHSGISQLIAQLSCCVIGSFSFNYAQILKINFKNKYNSLTNFYSTCKLPWLYYLDNIDKISLKFSHHDFIIS